jgi:hypothetical protein
MVVWSGRSLVAWGRGFDGDAVWPVAGGVGAEGLTVVWSGPSPVAGGREA